MATYDLTQAIPSKIKTGDILNCPYSGTYKTITLPKGQYKLECWGAEGANRGNAGGKGGYSSGILTLESKTSLYLYSGGKGNYSGTLGASVNGGFNGGGSSHLGTCSTHSSGRYANSGGGGSDIRIASTSLYARIIVAGGGGGGQDSVATAGGYGGGSSGSGGSGRSGGGASQTAGGAVATADYTSEGATVATAGSFGQGGNQTAGQHGGGGGGGGWYGGGAGKCDGYGGGGSGYVYTSATASQYPAGCLLNSSYYLESASTTIGSSTFIDPDTGASTSGRSGNGYVRITIIEVTASTLGHIKLGTTWKEFSSAYKKVTIPYTRLEYIQSTGTQYIDTGVYHNTTTCPTLRMVLDAEISGSLGLNGTASYQSYYVGPMNGYLYYSTYYADVKTTVAYSTATRYKYDLNNATNSFAVYSADGTSVYSTSTTVSAPSGNRPLYLFAYSNNDNGTIGAYTTQKLYSCQFYTNGVLVRDFVPCKNSSGDIGLLDLVNYKFYPNAGTGEFTAGPAVANPIISASVWQELEDVKSLFLGGTVEKKYVDYSSPEMADTTFLAINGLNDIQKANGYSGSIVTNSGVTESTDVPSNTSFTKSLYFDGNSFITFTNYDFAANDFTIEWWEKPTSDTAGTRFMSTYGTGGGTEAGMMIGWWCTTDLMPEIKWTSYDSYSSWNVIGHGVSAGNTDMSGWHHMAYIRSGSNLYVVKDSELINTQTIGTNEIGCNMSLPMCFGRRGSDTPNSTCYNGYLCGIRLSKSALYTQFGTYEEDVPLDELPKYGYRAVYNKYEVAELLPSGYTPVEYIENTGTQYIDTGYSASEGFIGEAEFEFTVAGNSNYIIGSHNINSPYGRNGVGSSSGNWQIGTGDTYPTSSELYTANVRYDLKFSTVKGNSYLNVNGNRVLETSDSTARSSNNILIFNNQFSLNINEAMTKGKLYLLKIYSPDNSLVRDFIPCKNSSGTIGLYDLVNSTFYSNVGSGTFTAGSEVENAVAGEFIEQVTVNNSTTYPDGGVLDGYYYIKVL